MLLGLRSLWEKSGVVPPPPPPAPIQQALIQIGPSLPLSGGRYPRKKPKWPGEEIEEEELEEIMAMLGIDL